MDISVDAYEKLGAFYLGREYDLQKKEMEDEIVMYDAKDLTTHAVCVGMTGSGKTGLCISLLEEAAIDGIPAIVIDPKGDIPNILLTFPELSAESFRPWVNEDDARRKGLSVDEYAAAQAKLWKDGLADWGQTGERIRKLRDAVDIAIYTPGSEAGIPVSVLDSFGVPPAEVMDDGDLLQERISTMVTGVLALLGIRADPLRSREHILLSSIISHAWKEGRALDLPGLIQGIQNPPLDKVGVIDLDSFYPAKERFDLAMQLNNLLASPGFDTWLSGVPLDISNILYTETGKPRVAIFSIAHLNDDERQFFVTLLLNEVLGWMRTRPGTNSLRALLYIDEIFGYMPPVANPPTKLALLTMLKQARAFGLGLVLATQNPVDLDYKGLSNTGTWFIGRLQTERDKMRVLEGLEGAAASGHFDKQEMEQVLAGLGKRVFLLHNVHESAPVVFHTRWAMSYLRGPMTRTQIKKLMAGRREEALAASTAAAAAKGAREVPAGAAAAATAPILPPDVRQVYLPARTRDAVTYRPHLVGAATVHFVDTRKGIEHEEEVTLVTPVEDRTVPVDWSESQVFDGTVQDLEDEPDHAGSYADLPSAATKKTTYNKWKKDLADELYRTRRFDLFKYAPLKIVSQPGETERDFRIRLADSIREERDAAVEKLRAKYERKIETAGERLRKAEQKVEREAEQADSQKMSNYLNIGATVLSAFLGRKAVSRSSVGKATSTMRGLSRSAKEKADVERALEDVEARKAALQELEEELKEEIEDLRNKYDPENVDLEKVVVKPRKTDIDIELVALAWAPYVSSNGGLIPAWD